MGTLEGKKILVIGGNGGIGCSCVKELEREGAYVLISGRSEYYCGQKNDRYIQAEMTDKKSIDALFEQVQSKIDLLDGFVYCSGIGSSKSFLDTTIDHFDQVISVNLRGAFYSSQKAVKLMREGGSIVFIASQKGLCGSTGSLAYNASKGGMVIMARSMALELGNRGIRVNCVCPGPTETKMFKQDMENQTDPELARRKVASSNPLNMIADSDLIAYGVRYVLSDEASFMTGTELVLDGGNISGFRNI